MNDTELRALVREAVARHLGPGSQESAESQSLAPRVLSASHLHASHGLYLTVVNATDACIIEPSVPCEHCGYCKSHGH